MKDQNFDVGVADASAMLEHGAKEFMGTTEMQPYGRYIEAAKTGGDVNLSLREIAQLPLEKRYVWRVASALRWGFADFDNLNVLTDRQTLKPEDLAKLMDLLRLRPTQFCMFLKTLVGPEEMERLMSDGIA